VYRFAGFYLVYFIAFAVPYLLVCLLKGPSITHMKYLWLLVIIAPAVFALKVNFTGAAEWVLAHIPGTMGRFYSIVVNLPSKLVVVLLCLAGIWWIGNYQAPFFGMTTKNLEWTPYLLMLLIMVPLIAWASTQNDFLHTYPKLKQVSFIEQSVHRPWPYKLLYELAYGIDFITIELFFRGFLVLAFVRYAGEEAILPMAVFYCSIHFGKPLAECISSFFGGMILGIVVYHTKSIWGGLMIHLGIAWLMEVGAVVGNYLKHSTHA
ncbi:MAG TPA: CPBP family intramembrane glutamic endopeptidase, partial [Niastella sp.]|nr:CPBP family intramembrane glutamic endopeptidase [Niastella sp.]